MGGPWHPYERLYEEHNNEDCRRIATVNDCKIVGGPQHSHVMYVMYDVWYFGELTKLRVYGLRLLFQVPLVPKRKGPTYSHYNP